MVGPTGEHMYTVLRFCNLTSENVRNIEAALDRELPGRFRGIDKGVLNRTSISVAADGDCETHLQMITETVNRLSSALTEFRESGVTFELDIALETEDLHVDLMSLEFSSELLGLLVMHDIQLEVTIYGRCSETDTRTSI